MGSEGAGVVDGWACDFGVGRTLTVSILTSITSHIFLRLTRVCGNAATYFADLVSKTCIPSSIACQFTTAMSYCQASKRCTSEWNPTAGTQRFCDRHPVVVFCFLMIECEYYFKCS